MLTSNLLSYFLILCQEIIEIHIKFTLLRMPLTEKIINMDIDYDIYIEHPSAKPCQVFVNVISLCTHLLKY